jgi:ubiquitin-protein ligase
MHQLAAETTILTFDDTGDGPPPERWVMTFAGTGLKRMENNDVVEHSVHRVEVTLGPEYPRRRPDLRWKTPIYHPNVQESGAVCLGGYSTHWAPSLRLDALCEMLWDMLRYANFDVRSPYNLLASNWTKRQPPSRFPLDARQLRDKLAAERGRGSAPHDIVRFGRAPADNQ